LKYINVSVRIFVSEKFIEFITYGAMSAFNNTALNIGVVADLELDALAF